MKPMSQHEYRRMMDQVHRRATFRKCLDALRNGPDGILTLLIMSSVMLGGIYCWTLLIFAVRDR